MRARRRGPVGVIVVGGAGGVKGEGVPAVDRQRRGLPDRRGPRGVAGPSIRWPKVSRMSPAPTARWPRFRSNRASAAGR